MLTAVILAAGKGGLTDVQPATFVWALVTFFVAFIALKKAAWPMLLEKMEEREVTIREGLEKAAAAEKRATELVERQESILQEARDEAQKLLADSRAAAENIKSETLAAAQSEIAVEKERAKKEIHLERAKAVEELRRTSVDLTLQAAGKLIERDLNDDDHRRLAAEVISQVETIA